MSSDMPATPNTWTEGLDFTFAKLRTIMIEKQTHYGPENINQGGIAGLRTRIGDKLARLDEALDAGRKRDMVKEMHELFPAHFTAIDMQGCLRDLPNVDDSDESFDDIISDTPNYFVIWYMLRQGWWNLPFNPSE